VPEDTGEELEPQSAASSTTSSGSGVYLGTGLYHLHQGPEQANRVPDGPQTQVPARMTTSAGPTHPPPRLATNS